jgi:hypothetical protein
VLSLFAFVFCCYYHQYHRFYSCVALIGKGISGGAFNSDVQLWSPRVFKGFIRYDVRASAPQCLPGFYFTGTSCRKNPCDPNPCVDGNGNSAGTCTIDNDHYVCDCNNDSISVTNCNTSAQSNLFYSDSPGKCVDRPGGVCDICVGDCDTDDHCAQGAVCFVRDSATPSADDPVPGCVGNPSAWFAKDFCVDETVWQCKDSEYIIVNGAEKDCAWVAAEGLCLTYPGYCRETCGYCRPRGSATANLLDYTWDD